jgi:hypothetical protein
MAGIESRMITTTAFLKNRASLFLDSAVAFEVPG